MGAWVLVLYFFGAEDQPIIFPNFQTSEQCLTELKVWKATNIRFHNGMCIYSNYAEVSEVTK